jgi:hypothetical protein
VYAGYQLVEQRVLALAADEARTAASGCSIDSRMAALRALGDQLGIDWLGSSAKLVSSPTVAFSTASPPPKGNGRRSANSKARG